MYSITFQDKIVRAPPQLLKSYETQIFSILLDILWDKNVA